VVSERYDPFGRPIEGEHPWARPSSEGQGEPPLPGGFLPPESPTSDAPPPAAATTVPAAPERPDAPPTEWPTAGPPPAWPSSTPARAPGAAPGAPPVESLATWGSRVGAYLIDLVAEAVLAVIVALPVAAIFSSNNTAAGVATIAATVIVVFAYSTVMLATTNGKTVGKRMVGIRVVRAGGEPMTWGRAALREIVMRGLVIGLVGTLTFGIAGILDVLWPLWDKQNQSLHDHGAETWVVRDR
jgi:uncharacterized RDD family membrane protein YckC